MISMQSTRPHVAFLASPGMGHLIPVLELAKRFVSQLSFKVTVFVVATDDAAIQNSQLLRNSSAGHDQLLDIVLLPLADLSKLVEPDAPLLEKMKMIMLESLPFLRSEISKMEFHPPAALVVDLFGTDALGIADEFNMLKYVFIASNARFSAYMLFVPEIDRAEIVEHVRNEKKPLNIPGCKPLKFEDIFESLRDPNGPLFQETVDIAVKISFTDGILVNSWDELEPTSLKALRDANKLPVYPIGPLVRPIEKPVLGNYQVIIDWLDKQPKESVIYVSFGSGGTLSAQQLIELALGLELSQHRFVWVVRPPKNDPSGSFFNVGNGSDGTLDYLPDGFISRTQERGLVVHMWAPQVEVLCHPSIGGFLTHCGWNSALESIVHGVPMIAWPLYAEQKMNAGMLTEDIGASIRVKAAAVVESDVSDGVVGREEIRSMVRKILVDDEGQNLRARTKEVKNSAAKALTKGGSSYNSMSQLAEVLIQHLETKAYGYGCRSNLLN